VNLTPKQLRVAYLVRQWRITRGYAPTLREIGDEMGVHKATVFEIVEELIRKGVLTREYMRARSLDIAPGFVFPDESNTRLPVLGVIDCND